MDKSNTSDWIKKFYSFDEMITPSIIKILFWVFAIIAVLAGISCIIMSFTAGVALFLYGIMQIVLGIIFAKVFCEIILVIFKINANLSAIKHNMTNQNTAGNTHTPEN